MCVAGFLIYSGPKMRLGSCKCRSEARSEPGKKKAFFEQVFRSEVNRAFSAKDVSTCGKGDAGKINPATLF